MALRQYNDLAKDVDELSRLVVDSFYQVHRALGPGYLEKIYEECLCEEFKIQGLRFEQQKPLHIIYKNKRIPSLYRLDLVVEDKIVIELKSVEKIQPVHKAQIMSYLKMSGIELGFLMNFNTTLMKEGLQRIVLKKSS